MKTAVRRFRVPLAVMLAASCFLVVPVSRGADAAPPPLDKRLRAEVIDGACAELERTYVEADTAKLIANVLRPRLKSGAYDQLLDRDQFAEAVTKDLRSMMEDIAILTGGKVITEDIGLKLESARIEDMGSAKRVVVDKDKTTIIEGKSKKGEH